jgi:hypothetical protein
MLVAQSDVASSGESPSSDGSAEGSPPAPAAAEEVAPTAAAPDVPEKPAVEKEPEPVPEVRTWTLTAPFTSDGGSAWGRALPDDLHARTDNNDAPYQSHLRLFEDGLELGPGHSRHETIRTAGNGHYSLWLSALYFSTSDGSDPNTNGRSYTVTLVD